MKLNLTNLLLKATPLVVATTLSLSALAQNSESSELYKFLKSQDDIVGVEPIKNGPFAQKYLVTISQPVDYKSDKGVFNQRFVVGHINKDSINVMVTEGYVGDYSLRENYREEISKKLNTNMIFVEHRYFSGSVPQPRDWEYMSGYNAANDLHRINSLMKKFYGQQRWLATGISKGGQNSIIYRTYFPDDVDVTVPYVAPICFGVEDGRHEPFLREVATKKDRKKILEYQRAILSKRSEIIPMMEEYAKKHNHTYKADINTILDYCVLEMPFSTWQWCNDIDDIPSKDSSAKELFDYLVRYSGPEYFIVSPTSPFFVQAAKELGYYGYETAPLKDLLHIKSSKGYLADLFLDDTTKDIAFDKTLALDIEAFLESQDEKMIFIYGEYDPWSAARAKDNYFKDKDNMILMIEDEGSHKARISTLSSSQERRVWKTLSNWLKRE